MDVVIERCEGIDIGKKLIVAAVRTRGGSLGTGWRGS